MTLSSVPGICLIVCAYISLISHAAFAQQTSAIAGVVRDGSGGVLSGVTVEAASPALVEKVRTVVTDDQGRYNIVDLRPGTYTVTFSLSGFNTLKREGIELTSGFTAADHSLADVPQSRRRADPYLDPGALEQLQVQRVGNLCEQTRNGSRRAASFSVVYHRNACVQGRHADRRGGV
jgi:hypothetical protein